MILGLIRFCTSMVQVLYILSCLKARRLASLAATASRYEEYLACRVHDFAYEEKRKFGYDQYW